MESHRDDQGCDAVDFGDFRVGMPFDEAEGKHFGGAAVEPSDGEPEDLPEVALVAAAGGLGEPFERDVFAGAELEHIQRRMNGRAPKIAFRVFDAGRLGVTRREAEEDGLEDVFGIVRVAGHAVRDAENQRVVLIESAFER